MELFAASRSGRTQQGLPFMLLSKRTRLLLVGILPVVSAGLLYAFTSLRSIDVTIGAVDENVPVRVFGLGTVEARVLSRVGFEVGAAIVELNVDHGDIVKQGQVLARLHATQQEAKVARAKVPTTAPLSRTWTCVASPARSCTVMTSFAASPSTSS